MDFEYCCEELVNAVQEINKKVEAESLGIQNDRDNILSLQITLIDKLKEFGVLTSMECVDVDLCNTQSDEIRKFEAFVLEKFRLYDERYTAFIGLYNDSKDFNQKIESFLLEMSVKALEGQEMLIKYQDAKIDSYQKGTKKKSEVSQQKWALAQLYFVEEIPKHKTLLSARKVAAQKAGIQVNERRLIQMLPIEK